MKFRYQALLLAGLFCYVLPEAKVLDSLVIEGLSVNSPNMVRNSLEIREGKDLSTADIQESIKRLYSLA